MKIKDEFLPEGYPKNSKVLEEQVTELLEKGKDEIDKAANFLYCEDCGAVSYTNTSGCEKCYYEAYGFGSR